MADARAIKSKRIFLFLRVTVVIGGVIFAVIWLSGQGRWTKLREINHLVLGAALAVFILSQIIIGLRWWILLRTQQIFIPFWAAVRLYFLGWFYNIIMPGSVGGDLVRLWYVTKHTEKKFEAALSVLVDRIIGLISTLIIAAAGIGAMRHSLSSAPKVANINPVSTNMRSPATPWTPIVVTASTPSTTRPQIMISEPTARAIRIFSPSRSAARSNPPSIAQEG